MKELLKVTAAPAAALVATIAFSAMLVPTEASAGDYCRRDVTGHITGCSFDSMAQCEMTRAGIGGDCFRDPWLGYNRSAGNAANAFAYQPRLPRSRQGARRH